MKKWAVVAFVAALAVGSGAAWALANRGDGDAPGMPSLAQRIASLGDDPSPASDLVMDRCYHMAPLFDESGALNPDLAAFPARLLDNQFELTALRFGDLCYEAAPTKMLETEWKHRKTGATLMVDQYPGTDLPTRIGPLYASFSDEGSNFHVMSLSLFGVPQGTVDQATALRVTEIAVEQLQPPVPLSCFYRTISKDWSDLAALGIGDPRTAIPNGYAPFRLDFTSLEQQQHGCRSTVSPPPEEAPIQLQAMFSGPGSSLLAIFARSLTDAVPDARTTFGPGDARWQNDRFAFSINWAPEHVSDEEIRAIARALDPGFGSVCALSARRVEFSDLPPANLLEPLKPGGLPAIVSGTFVIVGHSGACANETSNGFQARWLMEYRDRGGLVDVTALRGEQMPTMRPLVLEDTLYWRRGDGVAFYVSGLKAGFSHEELLDFARSVDPAFDESSLRPPPQP